MTGQRDESAPRRTVGELRAFLDDFDDQAQVGVVMMPYGGFVTGWHLMRDFEDEGIENPSPIPYPTLVVEHSGSDVAEES